MELLAEIKEPDLILEEIREYREAARAVLFDERGLIPLLYVSKYRFHKLPGGGIEPGENRIEALIREAREEVGSAVEITGELGKVVEYRAADFQQTSYCFTGNIVSKGEPTFTEREIAHGFQLVWMPLDDAIAAVDQDRALNREGWFIRQRDLVFLTACKNGKDKEQGC